MRFTQGNLRAAVCLCAAMILVGCSGGKTRPGAKIHGTIRLDGKPLSEGSVQFTSTRTGEAVYVNLTSDGQYLLDFPEIDVATSYDVTVQAVIDENQEALAMLENPPDKKKNLIPPKYSDRKTSGLKADSIVAGDNEFNFDLVSQ